MAAVEISIHYGTIARIKTYLSASFAHVRLLTGVDTLMDCQGRTLNELFATVGIITDVRADTAVNTFCRCQCAAFPCCGPSFLP